MNNKIKAAAEERYPLTGGIIEEHIAKYKRMAFTSGAEYFRKESGVDELRDVLREISKGQNGELMGEFIGRIKRLSVAALSKSDLFFNDKNLKDE